MTVMAATLGAHPISGDRKGAHEMTVTKTIDLSGTSTQSLEAAIEEAVSRAALTISDVHEFEIERVSGSVKDGRVDEYRVWLKVTFIVKEKLHE
jgi:flavin-binding protein dodecin